MIHRSRQNAALICAASLLAASLPAVSPATAAGDAPALIVLGPEHRTAAAARLADLTPDQATVLDTLRSNPRVSKLRLGRTPRAALADVLTARALSVHIPPAPAALSFTGVAVKHHGEGMVSLSARTTAQGSAIRLVVQGVDVLGSVEHDGETWRVTPLGGGVTAVYRYDIRGLRMDPPGWGMLQRLIAPKPRPMDGTGVPVEEADTGDVIDVMVVYTPNAAAMGSIDLFIQSALNNASDIYRNSRISTRLRLVHKAQVDYTQAAVDADGRGGLFDDITRLSFTQGVLPDGSVPDPEGSMDEIHALRDRYGADLVALFVAAPAGGTCGIAYVPSFGEYPMDDFESLGFSVTARECEGSGYSVFTHEIGHNQGARHDPYNAGCPTGPDSCDVGENFPWRYGRCNTDLGWRTAMAYGGNPLGDCPLSTRRFSSPVILFQGVPTGDADRRDNRRVLLETAQRVANFRQSKSEPPPPPPPNSLQASLPYVAPAGVGHPSLVRVLNDSAQPNTVQVTGYNDTGRRFGPVPLSIAAHEAATLTSAALESGGTGFAGLGDGGEGWWRLELEGERPFRAGMYYRRGDGFIAGLSAPVAGEEDGTGSWLLRRGVLQPGEQHREGQHATAGEPQRPSGPGGHRGSGRPGSGRAKGDGGRAAGRARCDNPHGAGARGRGERIHGPSGRRRGQVAADGDGRPSVARDEPAARDADRAPYQSLQPSPPDRHRPPAPANRQPVTPRRQS